jgi:cell division protease FtsH
MIQKQSYRKLLYRARAVARIENRKQLSFWDIVTAAISIDDEWTDKNFRFKDQSGLIYKETEYLKKLIGQLKSFKETEEDLKKSISFENKDHYEKLKTYINQNKSLQNEELLKNVLQMVVDIAVEHYRNIPDYISFGEMPPGRMLKYNKLSTFLTEQKKFTLAIKQEIFGQDEAVERLVDCFTAHVKKVNNFKNKEKLLPGSVFLLGDLGTGKTSLAKTFADKIPGSGMWGKWHQKFIRLKNFENFSYYSVEKELFIDYFSELTNKGIKYVFIIDEVYHASSELFSLLQQIMGEGIYTFRNKEYHFSDTFFVFITNHGESLYNNNHNGVFRDNRSFPRDAFRKSLLDQRTIKFFDGDEDNRMLESFIDRVNDFIILNSFNFGSRKSIFSVLLEKQKEYLNNLYDIEEVSWCEEFLELLVFSSAHLDSYRQIQRFFDESFFHDVEKQITECCRKEKEVKQIDLSLELPGSLSALLQSKGLKRLGKFLFVDDHEPFHTLLRHLGFINMVSAYSVAEAKRKLNEIGLDQLDWMLLDLVFPPGQADGLSFLDDFRKKHKLFPVYLFSQKINTKKEFNDISRAGGAAGFIEKSRYLTDHDDSEDGDNACDQLKDSIMKISLDCSFMKTKRALEKKGESINYILSSCYNEERGVLYFKASDLRAEPQLQLVDASQMITQPDVSFADIKGQKSVIEEIRLWLNRVKTKRISKTDKGLLLYGPPGTGKTLLAKAIANEIDAFFIALTPSQLQNKYVGESEKMVRELFSKARKNQPSVIFLDEIDSIGDRSQLSGEYNWQASFVNAFLAEMDGFEGNDEVFVIGATNHKERMDKALIRPGRLGRFIYVPLPKTLDDRKEILLFYLKKALMELNLKDEEVTRLAKVTKGYSPADIMLMVDVAQDIASKERKEELDADCLSQARTEVMFGKVSGETHDPETLRKIAIHEAGHALVARQLGREIYQVTVQKREGADDIEGFMEPTGDNKIEDRENILEQMAISFAGREAEKLILGKYGTGASSDLKKSQYFAEAILTLGLTDSGLPELFKSVHEQPGDSTYLNNEVTRKIQLIMKEAQECCIKILNENKDHLEELIEKLISEKTIFFYD